jgi:hypothetical protein
MSTSFAEQAARRMKSCPLDPFRLAALAAEVGGCPAAFLLDYRRINKQKPLDISK